jgi:hypothetical protein
MFGRLYPGRFTVAVLIPSLLFLSYGFAQAQERKTNIVVIWGDGDAAHLGGAVHPAASPKNLQPANGPIRARRYHVEHLPRLVDGTKTRLQILAFGYAVHSRQATREWCRDYLGQFR